MQELINKVEQWAEDRNFFGQGGANSQAQFVKLLEEVGELAGHLARGKDTTDDIGDIVVVLTILARLQGTDIKTCLEHAYNDIKNRKGQWQNGMFIKERDL